MQYRAFWITLMSNREDLILVPSGLDDIKEVGICLTQAGARQARLSGITRFAHPIDAMALYTIRARGEDYAKAWIPNCAAPGQKSSQQRITRNIWRPSARHKRPLN